MRRRTALLSVAAVVVLAGSAAYALQSGRSTRSTTDIASNSGKQATQDANSQNKQSAAPLADSPALEQNIEQSTTAMPQSMTAQPEAAPAAPQATAPACTLNISSEMNAYNRDVKKERNDLDMSIERIRVGVLQVRGFVTSYNDDVTKLFDEYKEEFGDAGCVFPINKAETLPSNYRS